MDLEDTKSCVIFGGMVISIILAFILPIIISINIKRDRNIEFEKYKIEMQYKHGDIAEEKEEVK